MLKLGILLITIGFFVGCTTSKEDALMQSYKQKVDYHKQLQKTEKIQLFENNVTKVVLTATYLYKPNFEKYDARDEKFIIGVHLEDETEVDLQEIIKIFGIRDKDDIKKMRDKQKKMSKVVKNSLYDDISKLISNGADKNETITIDDEKKINDKNNTEESNTTVPIYGLTLNKKKAINIKALKLNDKRLKNIAYITEWGYYYLVTFEHTNSKRFSLLFESKKYGKGTFSFAKVAKYIYTKKGF